MFSWLRGSQKYKEVEVYNNVIDGLKKVYKKKLRPLEEQYKFGEFHSPYLNDGDFDAKPMVLLIGQYSTGKTTFIRYLLEKDFPGIRIGPEPTTDRFMAIMHGPHEQVTPGNALAVDPQFQFRALQQFGNSLLSRLEASFLPHPVLESITLVDTPGILSGEKQRLHRGYDFEGVIAWFADRADMIILLFDAHKLDISDEFRRVIDLIKKNQSKIRIVLNKADMISTQQLMRVYGALMWSLGKVLGTPEVIRVYISSFWDRPFQLEENRRLYEAEQEDLFADIQSLPRTAAVRKLNDMIKRARLAKVHAYIMSHLRSEMPSFFYKQSKQEELIDQLDKVFLALHKSKGLPVGDFPSVKQMKEKLLEYDFTKFPRLHQGMIDTVEDMLAVDISNIMKMLPREEARSKDHRIKGGAFGYSDADPFSQVRDLSKPTTYAAYDEGWIVAQDAARYDSIFEKLGPNPQGKIVGNVAREQMMKSKLPNSVLRRIWVLADIDEDGMLDSDEFAVAMFLIDHKLSNQDLPDKLPDRLIPPSKRAYFRTPHPAPRRDEESGAGPTASHNAGPSASYSSASGGGYAGYSFSRARPMDDEYADDSQDLSSYIDRGH